jgi:hypothetical protein
MTFSILYPHTLAAHLPGKLKKLNLFFICFLFLISLQTALAESQQKEDLSPESPYNINNSDREAGIKHDLKYNGCNGFIRGGYIQTNVKTINNAQAYSFGGELGCGISWGPFLKIHSSAFTAINPGFNRGNKNAIQGDFFNQNKQSYITLGEAVMTLSYAGVEAHIGPQRFDSPHMDQDDLRLLPNIFEAYLIDYHINQQFYLGSGFIRTAKGWENNNNAEDFVGIGDAFGGNGSQSWISWGTYQQDNFNASAWYYYIKDVQQIFYIDMTYQNKLNDIFSYELGGQFDLGRSVGIQSIGLVDATTLGVKATMSAYNTTLSIGYNKNFGQSAAVNSVGGGPFYTSMEQMTLDAISAANAQALLLSLEYQPIEYLTLGLAIGDYQAKQKSDFHIQELNTYLSFHYNQHFTIDIMYAPTKGFASIPSSEQYRVILGYQF